MHLADANQLLDDVTSPFESGWIRHADGRAHVAGRTHMVGCKASMVEWWFSFIKTTEHYKLWHPRDHVFSDWIGERGTGRYIGGTHLAALSQQLGSVRRGVWKARSPQAAVAARHVRNASSLRTRSVRRDVR